ncbi:MAG: NAD(P)H-hydrate dehydratase, partial [Burkholderiaceae bacterium]
MGSPLFTAKDLRAIEAEAQASLAPGELMQRAGRAAAHAVIDLAQQVLGKSEGLSVGIVCGPGNNGGDGYVAACELRDSGHRVVCVRVGHEPPTAADAAQAFARWSESGGQTLKALPDRASFDVVVDAMFGIGLRRPLSGDSLAATHWINRQPLVCAIDVPSGLDADCGAWVGGVAGVCADATITMIADKPGLHTADGVDAAGSVQVASLGLALPDSAGSLITPTDFGAVIAPRRRNSHKGLFGTLAVVGGSESMVGAALLAARAALRFGAGRVFVELLGNPGLHFDPVQPELMMRSAGSIEELDAIVIGCGLGVDDRAHAALSHALERTVPLVIDADALALIAADRGFGERVRSREDKSTLTPHPLEAARLLGSTSSAVQGDRISAALELARRTSSIVVLKGAGTVIADTDGRYAIN